MEPHGSKLPWLAIWAFMLSVIAEHWEGADGTKWPQRTLTDICTRLHLQAFLALVGGASVSQETKTLTKKVGRLSGSTSDKHR